MSPSYGSRTWLFHARADDRSYPTIPAELADSLPSLDQARYSLARGRCGLDRKQFGIRNSEFGIKEVQAPGFSHGKNRKIVPSHEVRGARRPYFKPPALAVGSIPNSALHNSEFV